MKREHLILIVIIVLGAFLRFYRLDTQYIRFNDTFWRLTPALELSKGVLPSSYGGMPGISFLFFPVMLIKSSVMAAQIVIVLFGTALILLSYYFSKKVLPDCKIAPFFLSLSVAVNPSFVALSKVMMWDIVVLFFLVIALITTYMTAKNNSFYFTIGHFVLLFFLVFLKAPNLLFFPFSLAYILYMRCFDNIQEIFSNVDISFNKLFTRRTKDIWIGVVIFFILYGLYLHFFPTIRSQFESGGGEGFFQEAYYSLNLRGTIRTLIVPLNTPASNIYFALQSYSENYLRLTFLAFFQVILTVWGIISLRKNRYTFFLLSIFFAYAVFYFFFTGWSARYLCISIFILLFFLSIGVEKTIDSVRKQKLSLNSFFSLYLLIGLIVSLSFSILSVYTMEKEWGTEKSLKENFIEINYKDAPYILKRAEDEDVSLIVSSYGRWLEFFKITEDRNIEILDMFDIESEEDLVGIINERLKNNEIVWYIKGWPEGYEWSNMDTMYNAIEKNFILEEIYKGGRLYTKIDGKPEDSFLVYRLEKLRD
ncbi:hypothetical protein DRN58_08590 [Thermococci archaeon]|nr:MAG: hypothetical protein DRN58_08590 [Thermococci archaeon]